MEGLLKDFSLPFEKFMPYIDAIEIHNGEAAFGLPIGPLKKGANNTAQKYCKTIEAMFDYPNVGALSTSDGHSLYELGSSWTELDQPNIVKNSEFINSLRESIRKTNSKTPKKMKNSIVGAIDHLIDLVWITMIAPKLSLGYFYETDRP
jgi:hypothetical protein